jgi:hypothetical protein
MNTYQPTPESEFEPEYNLQRSAELNRRAGAYDPAFKEAMEQGRAEAAMAIQRRS